MIEQLGRRDLVAWAAGFVDGEGSVSFEKGRYAGVYAAGRRTRQYRVHRGQVRLRMAVWQTRLEPLERLRELFGGSIFSARRRTERHADSWQWVLLSAKAFQALIEMEPFLVNKSGHVRIAREFSEGQTGTTWGPPGMPDEEINRRVVLQEAMSILNKRGPQDAC